MTALIELHESIAILSRRWLPMLLNRVGVEIDLLAMLRRELDDDDDDELRRRLELARHTVREISHSSVGETEQWAHASDEVISWLLRALELSVRNPAAAERIVAGANRRLFGLLVGHPPGPLPRPTSWWARLFPGRADARASIS